VAFERWNCGLEVRDRLIAKGGGKVWSCRSSSVDRYGRALASCEADGTNLNRWLVQSGWALSFTRYSHEYDADERVARDAKAGLWSGAFIAPWDWRSRNIKTEILGAVSVPTDAQSLLLAPAPDAPSPDCAINGNVNRNGECIYHLPGGRYYSTVKMETGKGKRWCFLWLRNSGWPRQAFSPLFYCARRFTHNEACVERNAGLRTCRQTCV
jgi:Staphylococcal nuclease homologue